MQEFIFSAAGVVCLCSVGAVLAGLPWLAETKSEQQATRHHRSVLTVQSGNACLVLATALHIPSAMSRLPTYSSNTIFTCASLLRIANIYSCCIIFRSFNLLVDTVFPLPIIRLLLLVEELSTALAALEFPMKPYLVFSLFCCLWWIYRLR